MKKQNFDTDVLFEVRTLSKLLKQDFNNRLASYGLTGPQGRILFFAVKSQNEGCEIHQNDFEKKFNLSKSTVSDIVSRMVKNKYLIKEKKSPYYVIYPTEKGTKIVNEIESHKKATFDKMFEGFKTEEIETVSKYVNRMIENLVKEKQNVAKN